MLPYVDMMAARMPDSPASNPIDDATAGGDLVVPRSNGAPSDRFNMLLHELRTVELRRLAHREYGRVVSIGASGRSYFDWFEGAIGSVDEHIGVEAFEPEPSDLPSYARWISGTAEQLEEVGDAGIDIVFAGQTAEHLWAQELAGFLLESRRVLRPDGLLVIDSPNRLVTEHLHWSHGGHTVELAPTEMTELLTLAGFRTDEVRGLWRCRFDDSVLQLEERLDDGALLVRRILDGPDRADDCFVWWLVARPQHAPDEGALRKRAGELYEQHWPARVCRGMWPGPAAAATIDVRPGEQLMVVSLPFMLAPGAWRVGVTLAAGTIADIDELRIDVTEPDGQVVHRLDASTVVGQSTAGFVWEFTHACTSFALSLELRVNVTSAVSIAMPLAFERSANA